MKLVCSNRNEIDKNPRKIREIPLSGPAEFLYAQNTEKLARVIPENLAP